MAEWTGFENQRPSRDRGFKSHPLRHPLLRPGEAGSPCGASPSRSTVSKARLRETSPAGVKVCGTVREEEESVVFELLHFFNN